MKLYVLDKRNRFNDSDYCFAEPVDQKTGDFEKCESCGLAVGSRQWLPPHIVKFSKSTCGDMVFGSFTTFLVSDRFKKAFEESGMTGVKSFEPVKILKVRGKDISTLDLPDYYYVTLARSRARVDDSLSELVREGDVSCELCRGGGIIKSFRKIVLERETWDGGDIFFSSGLPGTIITSNRFFEFVQEHGFTNVKLVMAEEYSIIGY